jgi:hypothetical protein
MVSACQANNIETFLFEHFRFNSGFYYFFIKKVYIWTQNASDLLSIAFQVILQEVRDLLQVLVMIITSFLVSDP